ncbi:MAG: flagella basal body P-ring formation protein FlgA [Planctomycetes bacterium GWF2_42_9]|nr:MAG: flagella basal body P-ring formation protein FlgA [Planctomycetes bacterium GWF2_42_9]
MKKILFIILAYLMVPAYCFSGNTLIIYLPREINITTDSPSLGDVAVIQGDEILVAKANSLKLGVISPAAKHFKIEKSIILSSLACAGISSSQVTFTGADEITISRKHTVITGQQFLDKAIAYLVENPPHSSVCKYSALRTPQDLAIPDTNQNVKLIPNITDKTNTQVKIEVTVLAGENQIDKRDITFALQYTGKKIVAKTDLPQGTVLTPENVAVENCISTQPLPANWSIPYGSALKKSLAANSEITMNLVEDVKPQVILKRNQNVLIKIEKMGLVVTAIGKTLQDGCVGDCIKVQNLSSQRIIIVKVKQDGSVEPIF